MTVPPPSEAVPKGGRRAAWVAVFVAVSGLALTLAASRATGPTFDEDRRMAAVHRATELVRAVVDFGPSALRSSSAQAIYEELVPLGPLPAIVSGWFGEVLAAAHVVDRLLGARLGWLLVTGLAPAAVFFIVAQSRGVRVAALSACLLLSMPRWIHAAAAARESAIIASIWLLVLAFYFKSIAPRIEARRRGERRPFHVAAAGMAIVFGLGLGTSLSTLWVLPLILLHAALLRPDETRRAARRGAVPVPAGVLLMIVVSPVVMLGVMPSLWSGNGAQTAEWLLAPLAPSIEPILYRGGPVVSVRDVPAGYALRWLFATTPSVVMVFALAGAALLVLDWWGAREEGRPGSGLGRLLLIGTAGVVAGPWLTPAVLTRFPPRVEAALPFVAIAAAVALDRVAVRVLGDARAPLGALVAGMAFLASGLIGVPTASAAFSVFGGGTARAVEGRQWTVGDGSELAGLAPAIDKLGLPRLFVDAPEVPRGYWTVLERAGRLRTKVEPGRSGALSLAVQRGARAGAIATVSRDGATLWSLSRP